LPISEILDLVTLIAVIAIGIVIIRINARIGELWNRDNARDNEETPAWWRGYNTATRENAPAIEEAVSQERHRGIADEKERQTQTGPPSP
jgi:hypothetical protein